MSSPVSKYNIVMALPTPGRKILRLMGKNSTSSEILFFPIRIKRTLFLLGELTVYLDINLL